MKRYLISAIIVATSYGFLMTDDAATQPVPENAVVTESVLDRPVKKTWKPSAAHVRTEKWLAGVMFGECRGRDGDCMLAVGHVAMNRAKLGLDDRYGRGLWGVLNKRKQFSCLNKNDPNRKIILKAIAGKIDPDSADGVKWAVAQDIAHDLMHRNTEDPTKGAIFYHTPAVKPKWINDIGMKRVAKIDGHIFYRKDV